MIKKILGLCLIVGGLSSCGSSSPQMYTWYNYNDAAYSYMKNQTENSEVDLLAAYNKTIDKQKGTRGVVPPGIYAEKGYLLIKSGKTEEGVAYLKKEVELYPESEKFVGKIIKQYEEE